MKIIKWKIGDTPSPIEGQLAVAIGNFDGIHKGHVKLLNQCKLQAKESNLAFGVVTFDPHPRNLVEKPKEKVKKRPVQTGAHGALNNVIDEDYLSAIFKIYSELTDAKEISYISLKNN